MESVYQVATMQERLCPAKSLSPVPEYQCLLTVIYKVAYSQASGVVKQGASLGVRTSVMHKLTEGPAR